MRAIITICSLLLCLGSSAQTKSGRKVVEGEWYAGKTLMDPKVGVIRLIRVDHLGMGHGTFLSLKDSTKMTLRYSPMCGNDCIWNYEGKFNYTANKLTLKFNTYAQHGFCKSVTKSYNKNQMNFIFKVDASKKDTLILTRVTK